MLIKTSELSSAALDWAVAQAEGVAYNAKYLVQTKCDMSGAIRSVTYTSNYRPSSDWAHGGPLIDKFDVWLSDDECEHVASTHPHVNEYIVTGSTKLIAACRSIVHAKLGDEVEVPDELLSAPL